MMGVPEPAATLAWARSREAGAELFHGKFLHTRGGVVIKTMMTRDTMCFGAAWYLGTDPEDSGAVSV